MSEIAFIGDRDTVWIFQAFDSDVFFSDEQESVTRLVSQVLQGGFKIIFVTEDVYDAARELLDALQETAIPTVAVIPSVEGSRDTAMQKIRDSVRRATGTEFI